MSDAERVFAVLADAPMTETEVAISAGISLAETVESLNELHDAKRVRAIMEADGLIVWSLA